MQSKNVRLLKSWDFNGRAQQVLSVVQRGPLNGRYIRVRAPQKNIATLELDALPVPRRIQ